MSREYYQIKDCYKHLKHPERYTGKLPLTLRSSWEIKFVLKWLDVHQDIISWESESLIIPYKCPVRNFSVHRYFPDFTVKMKDKHGMIIEFILEIKPLEEILLAEGKGNLPKRMTKSAIEKLQTAIINKTKWNTAEEYCKQERQKGRNIHFWLIHQKNSPIPFL